MKLTLLDELYVKLGKSLGKTIVIDKEWRTHGNAPFPGFMLLVANRSLWDWGKDIHISSISFSGKKR